MARYWILLFQKLTQRPVFGLFLIHLWVTEIAKCFCFLSYVYASWRDINLQHFHQWLMSCSTTYWLSDSSFLSEAVVLEFSFYVSFVKTRTLSKVWITSAKLGLTFQIFSRYEKLSLFSCVPVSISFVCLVCVGSKLL